jgi:hypothetical protein
MVKGTRILFSSYYNFHSKHILNWWIAFIYVNKRYDNITVNYKGWRSFSPVRWLLGFTSWRMLQYFKHSGYCMYHRL